MSGSVSAKQLKAVFEDVDLNNDGYITRQELALAIRALGKNPTEKELDAVFAELGKDQQSIDFGSFKHAFGKPFSSPFDQDKAMRDAFKILDTENDGTILESELRQILLTVGDAMTHEEVDSILENITVDSSGKVQYDKLVDLLVNEYPPGQIFS
ncbi:myosin regulatory light chain-like [Schistocerca gregaria]|uniref:myosin regulatory light chain-like n=1 Tax=Schistocerca gregaria TaxID=7010 RepID=UPI00211E94A2|nr:myosin regulatory light chain-like [Schistocerca gregaria]